MKKKFLKILFLLILLGLGIYSYYCRYEKNRISEMRNRVIVESIKFDINQTIMLTNQDLDRILGHYRRNHLTKKIYWLPVQDNMKWKYLITGADFNTFVPLDFNIAKDKSTLYDSGKPIPISSQYNPRIIGGGQFIVDDNYVYRGYEILTGVDRNTFTILTGTKGRPTSYAKDKNNIYIVGNIMTGVDYYSFKPLFIYYSKDKNTVYLMEKVLTGVDVESFEEIYPPKFDKKGNTLYDSKDKNNYYLNGKIYTGQI